MRRYDSDLLSAEINPTPRPAKKRPAMNKGWLVDMVCRITPRLNTTPTDTMRPMRRPSISPKGAAARAPKNVPYRISTFLPFVSREFAYCRQNRDNQRVLSRRDCVMIGFRREGLLPVVHRNDTTNCASVISEENAAKGHEEAHHNGWPTNRISHQLVVKSHNDLPCFSSRAWRRLKRDFDHNVFSNFSTSSVIKFHKAEACTIPLKERAHQLFMNPQHQAFPALILTRTSNQIHWSRQHGMNPARKDCHTSLVTGPTAVAPPT
jgi:hypothetical protein